MATLEWEQTRSDVRRASRVIPGYGTVVVFIRQAGRGAFLTALMIPEPVGFEPELIRQLGSDVPPKLFLESFVDALAAKFPPAPPASASLPAYVLLEQGKAIMCLKCGMESHNVNDVQQRFCGNCKKYLVQ